MKRRIFIDCETTGLDPTRHEPWEIAMVIRLDQDDRKLIDLDNLNQHGVAGWISESDLSFVVQLPLLKPENADPMALRINGYYDRCVYAYKDVIFDAYHVSMSKMKVLHRFLDGAEIVANNPGFDMAMIQERFRVFNLAPMWDYRLVDVRSMASGYLCALSVHGGDTTDEMIRKAALSNDTKLLSKACGVKPPDPFWAHEALPDTLWVREWYDVLCGKVPSPQEWQSPKEDPTEPMVGVADPIRPTDDPPCL